MHSRSNLRIRACRICDTKHLEKVGSLGNIAISDFTDTPKHGEKYPLELVYCPNCTLLQLAHNTPRSLLYNKYWYESAINPIIVKDLQEIASLCKGVICDIGCGDGTLLSFLPEKSSHFGVDPSDIAAKADKSFNIINNYWENVAFNIKFDTITAIACVYDLPDPNVFMGNIRYHLKPKGTCIIQLMTLQPMIENNDVGNICHEHLEYYSYKSLVYVCEKNGLEIFKVETNSMNGGSYRLFIRHKTKQGSIPFTEKEYTLKDFKAFFNRIECNKEKLREMIQKYPDVGVAGYGASTKANTILQYYRVALDYIVDVNPRKIGKYTITTGCEIIDYIPLETEYLWVFPYGFLKYFKNKEKDYKGKWITTIPEFKII